jgi:hypothetical protein
MDSLDRLPSDQRAVLELVLKRGRGYDDIARLLSVDRAAVRDRALAALDALGPQTRIPAERRAVITDYLLGQLPEPVAEATRERLAQSAGERAWARVLAAELAPIAGTPLPEIPTDSPASAEPVASSPAQAPPVGAPAPQPRPDEPQAPESTRRRRVPPPEPGRARPSSRAGGAILLLAGTAAVVVVVLVVILVLGGSSNHSSTTSSAAATAATRTTTATSSTTSPRIVAQINLKPTQPGSRAIGIAVVLRQGTVTGIAIRAQNVPANGKHDAYAVWLSNSPTDSQLLGFVNPSVGATGILQAASGLPASAARFKQILVSDETQQKPPAPGKVVLQGTIAKPL